MCACGRCDVMWCVSFFATHLEHTKSTSIQWCNTIRIVFVTASNV